MISDSWGWLGMGAVEVAATNAFGNVIFVDSAHRFWRISPEELSCELVADTRDEYDALIRDHDFRQDWEMTRLVEQAQARYGKQGEDQCFFLKRPAVLGGRYAIENVGTISRQELVAFAGSVARQIKDVADGEQVVLTCTD